MVVQLEKVFSKLINSDQGTLKVDSFAKTSAKISWDASL